MTRHIAWAASLDHKSHNVKTVGTYKVKKVIEKGAATVMHNCFPGKKEGHRSKVKEQCGETRLGKMKDK